jgi:hypothetical protein
MDAVPVSPSIPSFVSLSQSPVFRRQWSSTYAALQDGRVHRAKLMRHLVAEIPVEEQPLLGECIDSPLPSLSPGRVAQAFAAILAAIGTPARVPKPRGKSPGRAKGQSQPPRTPYPTVKKRVSKRKKSEA